MANQRTSRPLPPEASNGATPSPNADGLLPERVSAPVPLERRLSKAIHATLNESLAILLDDVILRECEAQRANVTARGTIQRETRLGKTYTIDYDIRLCYRLEEEAAPADAPAIFSEEPNA